MFVTIPLNTLLTRDTQAKARWSLAPWTRYVGQMLEYPVDLYHLVEDPLLNKSAQDGLVRFGDLVDDPYAAP